MVNGTCATALRLSTCIAGLEHLVCWSVCPTSNDSSNNDEDQQYKDGKCIGYC